MRGWLRKEVIWMQYIGVFLCVTAAWFAACLFTAVPARESAASAAAAGAVCAMLAFLLSLVNFFADLTLLFFLPLALVMPIQEKRDWETRLMALLPAMGVYAMLALLYRQIGSLLPAPAAVVLCFLAAAASAAGAYAMRGHFPPQDWREYFESGAQDQTALRRWSVYVPLGLAAGLEVTLLYSIDPPGRLLSAFAVFAVNAALCWGALYIASLMVSYRREKLTALIDQSYHREMQSFMSVIRSQRHDYNFHLQALSGLIDAGNMDECRQYLHHLVQDSSAVNTFLPVYDPAIAALIFSFRTMAMEHGIELHMDIQNDLKHVVTSVYETNKIIGNLLQNAIDEVSTHEDKSFGIHLYILKRGENCIIHVANQISLHGDPQTYLQEMYRPGHSTKTSHEGIGLSSIQNLLRRYRGVIYSRIDGEVIHCFVKIPIRMEDDEYETHSGPDRG